MVSQQKEKERDVGQADVGQVSKKHIKICLSFSLAKKTMMHLEKEEKCRPRDKNKRVKEGGGSINHN